MDRSDDKVETPRTDTLIADIDANWASKDGWELLRQHARQLERELVEANKRAHYEATWHNHYARSAGRTIPAKLAQRILEIVNYEGWQGEIFRTLQDALKCAPSHVAPMPMPVSRYTVDHCGTRAVPDGEWVASGDYAALEKLYIEQTQCTPSAIRQIDKQVTIQASEHRELLYDAGRYRWLRDNMRRMPLGENGLRYFFDQPGTMSFQEAVDEAAVQPTDSTVRNG